MKPHAVSGAEGSPPGKFQKPMDKPPKDYTANESVPRESFGAIPAPDMNAKTMDKSKKFSS